MTIDPTTTAADDLLQALAVGDLRADDADVAARLRAEPQLQTRWLELQATLAELQHVAASTPRDQQPPGPSLAASRAVRTFRAATTRQRARRVGVGLLAAAAAIWLLVWSPAPTPAPTPDPRLGSGEVAAAMSPSGVWGDGQPFAWPAVRGAVGYRLQVRAAADGPMQLLPDPALGEELFPRPSWQPSASERQALPPGFEWRAIGFDGSGQQIATSPWARTQR
ncbi:MAG: hypothetical protein INH34_19620 [Phycisphaerales bacterium]|nr:hypothetical protein [Phycisphaerales bacterium]